MQGKPLNQTPVDRTGLEESVFFCSSEVETRSEDCSSGRYPGAVGGICYLIFILVD